MGQRTVNLYWSSCRLPESIFFASLWRYLSR